MEYFSGIAHQYTIIRESDGLELNSKIQTKRLERYPFSGAGGQKKARFCANLRPEGRVDSTALLVVALEQRSAYSITSSAITGRPCGPRWSTSLTGRINPIRWRRIIARICG
jgi:hypothetical protein